MSEHLMGIGGVPPTPPVGFVTLYPKLDGRVYSKDAAGNESALTAPSNTDNLNEGIVNKYFTNERAQDAVAAALADTATIFFTYNDAGNEITAEVATGSITNNEINAAADILLTKLASMTSNKAVVSDGAGKLIASTTTAAEIGHVAGVTSSIQGQLDAKQAAGVCISALTGDVTATGPGSAVATIANSAITNAKVAALAAIALSKLAPVTANKALVSDASGFVSPSAASSTEVGYLSGVTSGIQSQIDSKQASGNYVTALTGDVSASGPGAAAATIQNGAVTNAKIIAGAGINVNKLEALTTLKAVVTDGNGFISPSAVSNTELGQLTGISGNVQTQIDSKQPNGNYLTALTGDIAASGPGSSAAVIQPGVITNAKIAALAGISLNKLQSVAADKALVSSASGFVTPSAVSTTELGYVQGVTGSIQTQIDSKQPSGNYVTGLTGDVAASGPGNAASTIQAGAVTNAKIAAAAGINLNKIEAVTASKALVSDASGFVSPSAVTDTELSRLSGITGNVQTQINGKQATGNYVTALTGDVVAAGPGSAASTIQAGAVTNSKIAAAAGINLNKLEATTANRALVSSASGFVSPSSVTDTELGRLSGVTGNVQTQIDSKQPNGNYLTALTGDVVASGPGSSASTIQPGAITNAKIASAAGINLSKIEAVQTFVEAYGFPQVGDTLIQMLQKLAWSSMLQNDQISSNMTIPSGHTLLRSRTIVTGLNTITVSAGATLKVI